MTKTKVMNWLQKNTMVLILVLVFVFFAFRKDGAILLPQNITNLIAQNAYVFILATGMLLCILTGGNIDLSVGSVVCFTGAVGALLMANGMNMWLAVLAMLAIGAFQAYWIAYVRVPPFITTLAGMLIFRGLSNVVLDGRTQSISDQTFKDVFGGGATCYLPDIFGGGEVNILCLAVGVAACVIYLAMTFRGRMSRVKKGYAVDSLAATVGRCVVIVAAVMFFTVKLSQYKGIPTVLLWVGLVIGVYAYITSKTSIGRHLYAVGGNEKATKLSGIDTKKVYFFAYVNMGFLAGLAGVLTIARMASAQPTYGDSYEMDAIGACFIGGASAYGGVGTVPGVIIGAVLMGVINLGMSIMGIDQNFQKVVKGGVLLAAAAVGTGVVGEGGCNISLGTSGTLFISSKRFGVDPNNALHAFAHADGGWHLMGCMLSAASCNKWLCDDVLKTTDYAAEQKDITPEKLGNNHVYFLPYLMGERSPINDTNARGAFIGMTMDTTRSDLVQAVLEGVAFAIRDSFEVARSLGLSIPRSKLCGGGSKSPLWRTIFANVLGIPLELLKTEQGPGYGGAMLAMVGCGKYESVQAAADALVEVAAVVEPDPQLTGRYEARYRQYRAIYPALKPVFPRLL